GEDIGNIQPITLTMTGEEVCVPLRLTAIAALSNMGVTALVLSDEGRAIPKNYYHVPLNLARIDWLLFGYNYRQLVAEADDEAGGNAFATEYAGSASIFKGAIAGSSYDLARINASTT